MIPIRLKMQNFLAYRSPQPLTLTGVHLACLTGANGAGKSSLLDAMTWALWGKARTRRDNDLVHLGASEMFVELDFLHEGQKYRVVRRRNKRGNSGSGRLDLFIFDDKDKLNEIRESSTNATQNRINALLRLDYDTFTNSAFLQQGQADAFTTQQPAKRKQILSNILGLEAWADYEATAKEHRDRYSEQVAALDLRLKDIQTELATEPAKKRDLSEAEAAHKATEEAKNAAETLLKEVEGVKDRLRAEEDKKADKTRRRRDFEDELKTVQSNIKRNAEQIAQYRTVLENREEIEQGYENLQAAREANDELNAKLRQLKGIDKQISELENALTAERTRLESERDTLQKQIERAQKQIASVDTSEQETLMEQVAELEAKSTRRETLGDQLATLNEEHAALDGENKTLYVAMNELKERIDQLEEVEGATCPLCGQALTEDHRKELLAELNTEGTNQGDTYRANITRKEAIQNEQKTLKGEIKTLADAAADLPRLRQQLGEVQAKVTAAEEAQRQLTSDQTRLDDVLQKLKNDDYAHDIREQLQTVQAQKDALGYDEEKHDEQDAALAEYRKFEEMQSQLSIAENSLPPLEAAQESAQEREKRITNAITELDAELIELEKVLADLRAQNDIYEQRHADVMRLRTEERQANNRVVTAQQALNSLKALRERKTGYEEKRHEAAEQKGIYDELRTAFGKNGVPAMIIETAIPELEAMTNELLSRMTDGRMAVTFSTQREKVTGGTTETLDIAIADELGTRGYELYSGGEAFRINFAVRVALSKLLARRAGAHLETLFIDEGFGTQDSDGRSRLIEAINAIKDDFSLILVITHIDDLKDAFPVHINVEKTASGSVVDVR